LILTIVVLGVLLAFLSPYDPEKSSIRERLEPPSLVHPFGTDPLGRDMLTRVLYGGRISLIVGVSVVAIALVIGVPIGAISGYFGGRIDSILMRFTDAMLSLPSLLVLILLAAILRETDLPLVQRNSVMTIAFVIGILSWMTVARLVRASFITFREMNSSLRRAVSASDFRIIAPHSDQRGWPTIVSDLHWRWAEAYGRVRVELSRLRHSTPTPSWGNLLSNAQEHMSQQPWLAIFPGLMIFLTLISINYIGDGLRDALDPYKVLKKIGEV
jgi:peptide/nickel transport system permease protein